MSKKTLKRSSVNNHAKFVAKKKSIVKKANSILAASDAIRHPVKSLTVKLPLDLYELAVRVAGATGVSISTVVILAARRGSHGQETALMIAAASIMSAREGLITPEEAASLTLSNGT
jgi:hypothetical protein